MPFEQDHSMTPRAGLGHEIFAFDSVPVPPTNADSITNQAGPSPSLIIPADENVSEDVTLGVTGSIRAETALLDFFPIKIKTVDLSKQSIVDFDLTKGVGPDGKRSGENAVAAYGAHIAEGQLKSSRLAINRERNLGRFSMPRVVSILNNQNEQIGDFRGLKTTFSRFPEGGSYLPIANDMPTAPYGSAPVSAGGYTIPGSHATMVWDEKNDRLCVFSLFRYNDLNQNGHVLTPLYIHGLSYKQGLNTFPPGGTQPAMPGFLTDLGVSDKLFNGPLHNGVSMFEWNSRLEGDPTDLDHAPYQIASVFFKNNIYCIISDPTLTSGAGNFDASFIFSCIFAEKEELSDRFRAVANARTAAQALGTRILNISAAANDENVCLAAGVRNYANQLQKRYGVSYTFSSDLSNWGVSEEPNDLDLKSIGTMNEVWRADTNADEATPVVFHNELIGFFGSRNKIYKTTDGGVSWMLAFEGPLDATNFYYLSISGESSGNLHVWAYSSSLGLGNAFFKTENGGATWFIQSMFSDPESKLEYSQYFKINTSEEDGYDLPNRIEDNPKIGHSPSTLMAWRSPTHGWHVSGASILYTENGGDTWLKVVSFQDLTAQNTASIIHHIRYLGSDGSTPSLLVLGNLRLSSGKTGACLLYNPTTATPTIIPIDTPNLKTARTDDRAVCTNSFMVDPSSIFICGYTGYIAFLGIQNPLTETPTITVSPICTQNTTEAFFSIHVGNIFGEYDNASQTDIILGGLQGKVWTSVGTATAGPIDKFPHWTRHQIPGGQSIGSIAQVGGLGVRNFAIGARSRVYRGPLDFNNRRNPYVIAIPETNEFIMSLVNTDSKVVEIWKSYDGGMNFFQIETNITYQSSSVDVKAARCPITHMPDGSLLLQVFHGSGVSAAATTETAYFYVSYDFGENWDHLNIKAPVYNIDTAIFGGYDWSSNDGNQKVAVTNSFSLLNYGGNRVFALSQIAHDSFFNVHQNKYTLHSLYEWVDQGSQMTIIPDVPQDIGIDDMRIIFSGTPFVQDEWLVHLRHMYDVRNIAVESPSIFFKSATDTQNLTLEWSRPLLTNELGPGLKFNVDFFSLFKTNFRDCFIEITGPSYQGSAWPTGAGDLAEVTRFELSSVIEAGEITQAKVLQGIFRDESKRWIPHQFQSGNSDFFLKTYSNPADDGTGTFLLEHTFRIKDNTEESLVLEQDMAALMSIAESPVRYEILCDRMICLGDNGSRGVNLNVPPIIGSRYAHPGIIRLTIPAQKANDGYFKIGRHFFGTQTPIARNAGHGQVGRRRFSRGFEHQPIAFTETEVGVSGVSATENFGRVGQRWGLNYENVIWWDRDYTLNGFMSDPSKSFVFIFDNKKLEQSYLVKLESTPVVTNTTGDFYNFSLALEEIV